MQGKINRLFLGVMLLIASQSLLAQPLPPDPAWKQGTLDNGFHWQILATPQRPLDRIEVRLSIRTGSLAESRQQAGYSQFLPRLAFTQSGPLSDSQAQALWWQSTDPQHPAPQVISSYHFTRFNLSLPNNRQDLLKDALLWLANSAGNLQITPQAIVAALQNKVTIANWPEQPQDSLWRYQLTGSNLIGHDPNTPLMQPVTAQSLSAFYHTWYTPDVMTLVIVGNVDARALSEQIIKLFSPLQGQRETPAPVPTLAALPDGAISVSSRQTNQDRLILMWDMPRQIISDTASLQQHWQRRLAHELMFQLVQNQLAKNTDARPLAHFHCQSLFQRERCWITLNSPNDKITGNLKHIVHTLAALRKNGASPGAFSALLAQQQDSLQKLFTTYAHTDTRTLMEQHMQALRNQSVSIAPEQYQMLRQQFLASLTLEQLNQTLRQQLSRPASIVLLQPAGEAEFDMQALKATRDKLMQPAPTPPEDTTPAAPESAP